ncbi:MAG: hypothetical protein QOH87_4958, partial [Trebonia sp.]|nr:hypothetical protein [Trebonia sp.]
GFSAEERSALIRALRRMVSNLSAG